MEAFPWPVSLGIAGVAVAALITTIVFYSRKIANGEWVPRVQSEKAYDDMVVLKDAAIAGERQRADEWKAAAAASEAGRIEALATAKTAVESNKLLDYFVQTWIPKKKSESGTEAAHA